MPQIDEGGKPAKEKSPVGSDQRGFETENKLKLKMN